MQNLKEAKLRHFLIILVLVPIFSFATDGDNKGKDKDKKKKYGSEEILRPISVDKPPVIDGKLDDDVWKTAPSVTGFKTFTPDFGKDMEFQTIAYMAYDEENLYFAFKCYDDPNLIKTSLAQRDKIRDDDWICLNLDSFNDNQTLYGFYVNPSGIQMDTRAAGFRDDPGVDFVWYSAGEIDEEGYNVEMKIPFKSIRYANKKNVVKMGVVFERKITRNSTQGTYPALDPEMGFNFLIQTMEIQYEGVKKNRVVELLPAITHTKVSEMEEGDFISKPGITEFGVTGKFGITSDLILDATYNPDFSTVETDVTQVDDNQRFAIFYPERRPFFQEGSENFNFAGGSGREGIRSIVNTRTIVNPQLATKLSGKVGEKNRVAAIYARDELFPDTDNPDPFADVGVFRYRRNLSSDSYFGAFYTTRAANDGVNTVLAADAQYRLNQSSTISGNFLRSYDQDDPEEQMVKDYATSLNYSFSNRNLRLSLRYNDNSEDFSSDVGYVGRVGVTRYNVFVGPKWYFDKKLLQRIDNWISLTQMKDKPSGLWEKSYYFNTQFKFIRNSEIQFIFNFKDEIFDAQKFNRNNIGLELKSQINKRVYAGIEGRFGNLVRYVSDPYSGFGKNLTAELNLQLTDNINSQWRYTFSDFYRMEDRSLDFTRTLIRSRNTYQVNKYFFLRAIIEYDSRDPDIQADFLASFTLIPGTVVHLGYGSLLNKMEWDPQIDDYVSTKDRFGAYRRGVFFKASYLFRK